MLHENQSTLFRAASRLLTAQTQSQEDVIQAYDELRSLLKQDLTQDARKQTAQFLVESLRQTILSRAQALFFRDQSLFSSSDKGFFSLFCDFKARCYDSCPQPGDYQALAGIRPLLQILPQCERAEDVLAAAE